MTVKMYAVGERIFPRHPEDHAALRKAFGRATGIYRTDEKAIREALGNETLEIYDAPPEWSTRPITIDPSKKYRTRGGKTVVNLRIDEFNSQGERVTYPVRGEIAILSKKSNKVKRTYMIWTGIGEKILGKTGSDDLVEVTP